MVFVDAFAAEAMCNGQSSIRFQKIRQMRNQCLRIPEVRKGVVDHKAGVEDLAQDLNAEIEISLSDRKVQFTNESMTLQSRLLDGGYPETDRLIPKEFNYELSLSRNDLIHAIDRTTFIKNDNMTINRLSMSEHEVILSNRSQEIGESTEHLAGVYTGEPLDISFAGNYVLSAAKALRGNNIKIRFTAEMKPFILTGDDDDSVLQLVLPVRTYN